MKDSRTKKDRKRKRQVGNNLILINLTLIVITLIVLSSLLYMKYCIKNTRTAISDDDKNMDLLLSEINSIKSRVNYLLSQELITGIGINDNNGIPIYQLNIVLLDNTGNTMNYYKIGDVAKKYLYWGEVVNDKIGDTNFIIMMCPTFNIISVFERNNNSFSPARERFKCSKNAEWTMFFNQNNEEFDVIFGIKRKMLNETFEEPNLKSEGYYKEYNKNYYKTRLRDLPFIITDENGVKTLLSELNIT